MHFSILIFFEKNNKKNTNIKKKKSCELERVENKKTRKSKFKNLKNKMCQIIFFFLYKEQFKIIFDETN